MMNQKKRFAKNFILLSALWLVLAAVLVIVADPFFHYHKPLFGLKTVASKPEYQSIGSVRNLEYDSILLGSSVAENYNTHLFDEYFGVKTVKAINKSASVTDLSYYLEESLKAKEVKNVFYSLDIFSLTTDPEKVFPDETMPQYLFNINPFDDVNYVWNKDVIFESIPYMLARNFLEKDYDEGLAYSWAYSKTFSKEETLSHYYRREDVTLQKGPETYAETVNKNLDTLEKIVKKNPDVKFYFICPPYSMLWWDDNYRKGEEEQNLYISRQAAKRLLAYENVRMFYFQNDEKIITDLNNYMDLIHFSDAVNDDIVRHMAAGEYEITLENYEEEIEKMKTLSEKIQTEYMKELFP